MDPIPWLPPRTNSLIEETVSALKTALGETALSLVLVGNAMNPERPDRARAPEILAILAGAAPSDLSPLARALHKPMLAGARVRLLTRREIDRSTDVFALEVADWKARHQVLWGRDPFADLTILPAHLRHALETELRGVSRRIRNRVLAGLATDSGRDDPQSALGDGFDRFLVAAYHALVLLGEAPPAQETAIIEAIALRASADASGVVAHLAILRSGKGKLDQAGALGALVALVDAVTEIIDSLEIAA